MKRKLISLIVLALIITIMIFINRSSKVPIWEQNALELSSSFNLISGNTAIIDDLSGFTKFEWDTLYSFQPYLAEEDIYRTVGYKWEEISSSVSEGMNQIVFLKDGEVVCYVYGYPDKYNVHFELGRHSDGYFKLTSSSKLRFQMKILDGVRYFKYIQ